MSHDDCEICRLKARVDELLDALDLVTLRCENLHHSKRDRHTYSEPCPVVARIERLRNGGAA